METSTKRSGNGSGLLHKTISIGLVLIVSYIGSVFVQSIVDDRISNQATVLEAHAGVQSNTLIFGKLPGFDSDTGVSVYRLVDRVMKYAILFISLTFLVFFLTEIFYKLRLHPIQYLLVGLALAEFYLLLLALTEHIGFLWAYIAAAAMTIALVSLYSLFILKTLKGAAFITIMLTIVYAYLLAVLHLETLALLSGALLLFALLAIVMFLTRNLDWYEAFSYLRKEG